MYEVEISAVTVRWSWNGNYTLPQANSSIGNYVIVSANVQL